MPSYTYQCEDCEREQEIWHSIKDAPVRHKKHIKRGGNGEPCDGELVRLITGAPAISWKGGAPTPKHYE